MSPEPRSRRIALATGLTYHVVEWPGPDTRTFVLVHGFSDLGYGWEAVAAHLAPHGRVIAPDLRGHGDSDWIGQGGYYHFLDYVADLDEVIARLATGSVVVVGHSMGGSVASYWAGTRSAVPASTRAYDWLAGLVLLEGLGPPDLAGVDPVMRTAQWIEAWRAARARPHFRTMESLDVAIARLRKNDDLLDAATARRLAEVGTRPVQGGITWKHDPLHMTAGPYTYRLDLAAQFWQRITCPVLIVDGAQSKLNLPLDERARRRAMFRDHRYAIVEGAGHALQRHQPEAVARLILES